MSIAEMVVSMIRHPLSAIRYPLSINPTVLVLMVLLLAACSRTPSEPGAPLFTLLPSDSTGVTFVNEIIENAGFNVLEYEYFYNGGGVAVGDVNNDGLPDLYFTANMRPDELYLNTGNFTFKNISQPAGLLSDVSWTTGVTMADVNDDGWLDIYVCKSGRVSTDRRRNVLYINNGDLTFTERAAEYGLDDPSYSNHASFFDYDRDGDLDMFLLNHPIRRFSHFVVELMRAQRDSLAGDKLFRNDDGRFVDVSEEAGIIGNPLGFGLSAVVSDVNKDGWPDLYVANDYIEDDYLYINARDGTFTEAIRAHLTHTSYSSMGTDIADINNDALPDIITLDMLAEDHLRQKLLKGPEDFAFYQNMRQNGYHEQYMRNVLHVNQGNGTFTEIGQLAGVSNTDWSWAALLADYDNDGYKDLLVTNGYLRDYTNLDFLRYVLPAASQEAQARGEAASSLELVRKMQSTPLKNYLYRNDTGLTFIDRTDDWGLGQTSFSNGAAYADLDDDGDLDLVVNNVNEEAFIYRNNAEKAPDNHYLKIRLEGPAGNRFGIGTRVDVSTADGSQFYQEMIPGRGYLSSVEPSLFFGLGALTMVDLTVLWPDGSRQSVVDVFVDQALILKHRDARIIPMEPETVPPPLFTDLPDKQGIHFRHQENDFVDFDREPLLPHLLSRLGPALARGDVNQDGLEDVFVGGAKGQPAALFLQQGDGFFAEVVLDAFVEHREYEDVDALFFDVDQDRDLDLYVVSGGNTEEGESPAYQDRLYINGGFGRLAYAADALPEINSSGSTVAAHDYDGDGDLDLFVGGRVLSGRYPYPPRSFLLENRGGQFADVTAEASDALLTPGMITDARWHDLDGDDAAELVLAGEWMPLRIFKRDSDGTFTETTDRAGLAQTGGWWNTLLAADLDGDGDTDLVAGNRGLNAQIRASGTEPASIDAADFDRNGAVDAVISSFIQGQSYPVAWRDELLAQVPELARTFPTYASYATATMDDVLTPSQRAEALHLDVYQAATTLFENLGDGTFRSKPLPLAAQVTPVHGILSEDFDGDGLLDLLMAGNNFGVRAQWGRDVAGQGVLLLGKGGLGFEAASASRSGFYTPGDVRKMILVRTQAGPLVVVAQNDDGLATFSF